MKKFLLSFEFYVTDLKVKHAIFWAVLIIVFFTILQAVGSIAANYAEKKILKEFQGQPHHYSSFSRVAVSHR
ncbi:MAG: hypothetical protein LBR69_03130 [Endomicrobium sp.]|jgi:hypothetical protein|nr:hypothetical protein [Endomicrobium sp.]